MSNQNSNITEGFRIAEPGLLPEEWETISLGEVLEEVDYRVKDSGTNDIPILSMTRYQGLILQNEKFEKRVASRDVNNYKVVRKGHIVYGFPMDEGVIYTLRKVDIGAVSPVYEVWKLSNDNVDIEFLDQLLKTPLMISTYRRLTSNTVERRRIVSKRDFKRIIVSIPPLPEQKLIARVLSTVQKSIEAQDKIIAAARELKKSLIQHLFTYGLVPVWEAEQVSLKETEIGPVPEHWKMVRLGEVILKTKQVDPRREPALVFKYVDVSGISREQLKIINFTEYPGEQAPHRARKLVKTGDIIFATIRPYLKRMAIVPDEFDGQIVSTAFCVIRCRHDSAEPNYVFQAVTKDDFVQRVSEHQRGSSYPAVTDKDILTQMIPLPSIQEQQEIARMLSAVDNKIEAEENRKSVLQALFKTMLHQLMTGKVRVKNLEATAA